MGSCAEMKLLKDILWKIGLGTATKVKFIYYLIRGTEGK